MSQCTYTCPLCGSSLSREKYEDVLHIDDARKRELAQAEEKAENPSVQ